VHILLFQNYDTYIYVSINCAFRFKNCLEP
jgi:hypothetical protein